MKRLYSYLIVLMAMSTMMIACEAFDDLLPSIDNPTEVPDDGTNDGNDDGTDDGNDDGTDDGNDNGNDDGTPNDPEDNPGDKSAWSMVGAFNNWGLSKSHIGLDIPDIPMSVKGTVHTAEATLYRGMGFKLRKDNDWLHSRGHSYTTDEEYDFYAAIVDGNGKEFDVMNGGVDIYIPTGGKYLIKWDSATDKMSTTLLEEVEDRWVLTGVSSQSAGVEFRWLAAQKPRMYIIEDIALSQGDELIITHHGESETVYSNSSDRTYLDMEYKLYPNQTKGLKISYTGTYTIFLDTNAVLPTITLTSGDVVIPENPGSASWGVVGDFNNWNDDIYMRWIDADKCYQAEVEITIPNAKFKIRQDGSWEVNRGSVELYDVLPLDSKIAVVQEGENIPLADAGSYEIRYYIEEEMISVTQLSGEVTPTPTPTPDVAQWSIIGGFNDWNGDVAMTYVESQEYYYAELHMHSTADNGFKLRKNGDWTENLGAADLLADLPLDTDIPVIQDGHNIPILKSGIYRVEYHPAAEVVRVTLLEEDVIVEPKVYVDASLTGWEIIGVWAWNLNDGSINYTGGSWPGVQLTETILMDDITYYVWQAPSELAGETIGFIVNDFGGGNQTENLSVTLGSEPVYVTLTEVGSNDQWLADVVTEN